MSTYTEILTYVPMDVKELLYAYRRVFVLIAFELGKIWLAA
jgi:hypothetical protein